MKILQICAYAAPYPGNFINSLLALDKALEQQGHETIYAFCHNAQDIPWCKELAKKRRVYFLPLAKARILPKTYIQIRKLLKSENVDIVHSHFELYDLPLAVVKPKKVKMFWHLHDAIGNNYESRPFYRKWLLKIHYGLFSKQAVMCSVSQKHMDFAITQGFRKNNAMLILNGADLTRLSPPDDKTKKYDFLIFAWDFIRKGGDLAIEAAKKLWAEGYRFTIGFVGNEAFWERSDIKAVINEPWFVRQDFVPNVSDLYYGARAFLHISRAEGCSYALQESVYTGLSVISSDIDENMFLKGMPTVRYVRSEDVDDICAAMKEMISNNFAEDNEKKEISKQIIKDKYSIDAWVRNIVDVYKKYGDMK